MEAGSYNTKPGLLFCVMVLRYLLGRKVLYLGRYGIQQAYHIRKSETNHLFPYRLVRGWPCVF